MLVFSHLLLHQQTSRLGSQKTFKTNCKQLVNMNLNCSSTSKYRIINASIQHISHSLLNPRARWLIIKSRSWRISGLLKGFVLIVSILDSRSRKLFSSAKRQSTERTKVSTESYSAAN